MRFIEIDLDGTVVRAKLNEEGAPKTSQAVWDALPFEGRAVHAQLSGQMFRMLDHAPVGELEIEGRSNHQFPGSIVFLPSIQEIAFCVGEARFSGSAGMPMIVTELGAIEGDMSEFTKKGDALDATGAKPIRFRRATDQTTPFRGLAHKGRRIELSLGDATVKATLLEDTAPKTTAALQKKLPLEGDATNDTWGGQITRLRTPVDLGDGASEVKHLFWPGYAYYVPSKKELRVAYGECDVRDVTGVLPAVPVAAIDADDVAKFGTVARAQLTEGKKRMGIRAAS
ncbi:MAG TPA: DUF3830 family protein [Candidatus Limnocylindria bacterium]|nr:DUF3830 family protein [Candidatus Limnocylindria bacterium]